VFILEVMGRHAGWIAAAGGLAAQHEGDAPQIILFPEVAFDEQRFLARVKECVDSKGYCAVVVSEGVRNEAGQFLSDAGVRDAFGHAQLGGVAPVVAALVKQHLGYKYHWAVADYLQRAARHVASQVDVDHAYAVGCAAVEMALAGKNAVIPMIRRLADDPYRWEVVEEALADVANVEKKVPPEYITGDGFGITAACRRYLMPLIQGEAYPPYKNGLPDYVRLKNVAAAKKLATTFTV
jgi:6-phosphofructokinase 1